MRSLCSGGLVESSGSDADIPAVMIGLSEGIALRMSGATTGSAVAVFSEFITSNKDILAGFSSQGPTRVDLAIKPDLISIADDVLSSISCVGAPTCTGDDAWTFFSGTSLSAPHITGAAAVLLTLHSNWSPAQIKSALVNTADRVIQDAKTGTHDVGPTAQGAGRENLGSAANATVSFEPASASFGKVSRSKNTPTSFAFTITNSTGSSQTFSLAAWKFTPSTSASLVPFDAGTTTFGDSRISFPPSLIVPGNGATTLTVAVNPGLPKDSVVQGWITLTGPSGPYHFAYYAVVGP